MAGKHSSDAGRTWGVEFPIRRNYTKSADWPDMGYPPLLKRIDGKLVPVYYWAFSEHPPKRHRSRDPEALTHEVHGACGARRYGFPRMGLAIFQFCFGSALGKETGAPGTGRGEQGGTCGYTQTRVGNAAIRSRCWRFHSAFFSIGSQLSSSQSISKRAMVSRSPAKLLCSLRP